MPNVSIEPARRQQKETVANLMQLYLHDLSEYGPETMEPDGLFDRGKYFDAYWTEAERHPFLIWCDDTPTGFAFVREIEPAKFSMAEFFVVRGFRGTGVAAMAATSIFDLFRGEWQVAQMEANLLAQRFWRRVVNQYTAGVFEDRRSDGQPNGPMQVFRN